MNKHEPSLQPYGEKSWMLIERFKARLDDGTVIEVPKGFVTDFASVPWILTWFITPYEKGIRRAALIHDWLYATHLGKSRKEIDALFEKVMREDGMKRRRAKACFWAVTVCGKKHYMSGPARLREQSPMLASHIGSTPTMEGTTS